MLGILLTVQEKTVIPPTTLVENVNIRTVLSSCHGTTTTVV